LTSRSRDRIREAFITVLGSGYAPIASGSWGSLVATILFVAVWWLLIELAGQRLALELALLVGIALSSWLSVRWGEWAMARFKRKDPKQFVLDEFAGQWVALLWLPAAAETGLLGFTCVVGGQFLLFRILDIIKPPPARQVERWPAGWGILCDDLIAGAYANLLGQILWGFTPLLVWLNLAAAFVTNGG
jgi:phosphatidylglycerophosphatase A